MPTTLPRSLALAGLVTAGTLGTAMAWEAEDVAGRLQAMMDDQGATLEWSGVSGDGSSVTLEGVTVTAEETDETLELGTLTLEDVSEEEDHYRIGRMAMPTFVHTTPENVEIRLEDVSVSGLLLPKEGAEDPYAGVMRYDSAETGGAEVTMGEEMVFTMNDLHVEMVPPSEEEAMTFSGAVEQYSMDLEAVVEDESARTALADLDYRQITGRLDVAGSWRPSDGRMMLTRYDMSVDDAGTLSFTVDLGGYTPEFMATLREMQEDAEDGSDADKSAQGMAMLGMMQQLTFHDAMIRFDDDSLTDRALGYVAGQQGIERDDVANMAKALIPLQVAPYLGPELTGRLTDAVTTFLDDPQSLELRAEPEEPLPFAMMMGAAMSSPEALVKQLGLTITANEAGEADE